MSEGKNQIEEMKEEIAKFYNTYLHLLDATQYLRTDEALEVFKVISLLKNLIFRRWGAVLKRQDVKTVVSGNKKIVVTDVYSAEPYTSEYHIVKVTYHIDFYENGEVKHVLDSIETLEQVDIDQMNTPFTYRLQQRISDQLEEMREPWRAEIRDAIMTLAYAETQGELDNKLEEVEAVFRKEPILEYAVFLEAIRQTKKIFSEADE